jgi:hypothetical protein
LDRRHVSASDEKHPTHAIGMFINYFHTNCYSHSPTDPMAMGFKLKAKENFSLCGSKFTGFHPKKN